MGLSLWMSKRVLVLLCERASSFGFGWTFGANTMREGLDEGLSDGAFSYLLNLRV